MNALMTTLCYLERDHRYLMLHRVRKKNDVNEGKWIGVGGKFEQDESPEECLVREVREETGYTLTSWKFRGLVTFVCEGATTEYMCLYTADGFEGELAECEEGVLEWVDIDHVGELPTWEGDAIFLKLLAENHPWFSLKVVYDREGHLLESILDGVPIDPKK